MNKEITTPFEKKDYKKLDYEFVLKINDQIVCQRFFNIFNYNPDSIYSKEFKAIFEDNLTKTGIPSKTSVIDLIQNDLISKTRVYMSHVCSPFANEKSLKEEQEKGNYTSEIWGETDDEFKPKQKTNDSENEKNTLTFEFKVLGKSVMSTAWSADEYPKFIRNSINICNHQYIQVTPTYRLEFDKADENTMKYEHTIKKRIHIGREDLVPKIIAIIREVCSLPNEKLDLTYHPKNFGYMV